VTEIFTTGIANVKATYGKDSKHPLSDERVSRIQACMQYSIIQGSAGIREDRLSFLKPWGFSVSELAIPTQFWAGTADSDVPLEHSLWMARKIRNCTSWKEKITLQSWNEDFLVDFGGYEVCLIVNLPGTLVLHWSRRMITH
jgi:pimeloyl-ACP methyl ester carboxylesterase